MHNFSASPSQSIGIINGISIWLPMMLALKDIDFTIYSVFILTNQSLITCCVVESEVWQSVRGRMSS